jgi:hypothetical protein
VQPATTALAASPVADLGTYLADPPSGSYSQIPESQGSSSLHLGALDAGAVADGWAGTTGDLTNEGFTRGFQKAWKSSGAVYSAEVDEFNTAQGAKDHVDKARTSTKITITTYKADLATPGIPNSYGYTGESSSGSEKQLQIFFAKGNLAFNVGFYASTTPSASTAVTQAKKQYDKAPADSSSSPGTGGAAGTGVGAASGTAAGVVGIVLGLGGLLCVLLIIGLIIFFVLRSRRGRAGMPPPPSPPPAAMTPGPTLPPAVPTPTPVPAPVVPPPVAPAMPLPASEETVIAPPQVAPPASVAPPEATPAMVPPPPSTPAPPLQLSPDRHFWWDGTTWQDATRVRPPGVPVSPDGKMWHDGLSWRHNPE